MCVCGWRRGDSAHHTTAAQVRNQHSHTLRTPCVGAPLVEENQHRCPSCFVVCQHLQQLNDPRGNVYGVAHVDQVLPRVVRPCQSPPLKRQRTTQTDARTTIMWLLPKYVCQFAAMGAPTSHTARLCFPLPSSSNSTPVWQGRNTTNNSAHPQAHASHTPPAAAETSPHKHKGCTVTDV